MSKNHDFRRLLMASLSLTIILAPSLLTAQQAPTSAVYDINVHLRDAYKTIVSRAQTGAIVSPETTTADLNQTLKRLHDLDGLIRALGAGTGDDQLQRSAYRYRAIAWLHGWAIFSQLAMEAGKTSSGPEFHKALLSLDSQDGDSALALLLSIYGQLRMEEGSDDPLRHLLQDGTDLVYLMAYQESWLGDRPNGVSHPYYVPSASDLFGKPDDAPSLTRNILSLWSVINLEIDSWHEFDVERVRVESLAQIKEDPLLVRQNDKSVGWLKGNRLNLTPLAHWLDRIQHNDDIAAFGSQVGVSKQRLYKIQRFLEARQELSVPGKLKEVLHELSDCRLQQNSDPRSIIGSLIEAAMPLTAGDGQEEDLFEAAIWLRYVMLASYQNEGSWATTNAENSLEKSWIKFKLPGEFSLTHLRRPPTAAIPAGGIPFLRWNAWPIKGTSTAILADLTGATYAYLSFDQSRWEHEKSRFSSAVQVVDTKEYGDWVDKSVADLKNDAESPLASYFDGAAHNRPTQVPQPLSLTTVNGSLARAFRRTSTSVEQSRIVYDLSLVHAQIAEEIRVNEMILAAYRSGDPRALAEYLRSLNGISPLSSWNLYALPQFPFQRYAEQLDAAATELSTLAEQGSAHDDLQQLFHERQTYYEKARDELEAARLGQKVAAQARLLSETFSKIAQLDAKAADLERSVQELQYKGNLSEQQAKALSLQYAIQQREIAEAKVEALLAATQQATELVDQASKDLESVKASLISTADTIRDKKEQERNRSLINTVITVVGVALAPFTSGASLAIAAQVNQVVNMIDQIKHTNWSDFGAAVATVNNISATTAQTVSIAGQFAGPDVQTGLKSLQTFLVSANNTIQQYSTQARTIYTAITNLPQQQDVLRFASAIASGIPISYDGSTHQIRLELDANGLVPVSVTLQSDLAAMLDTGAIMVNDTKTRAEQFANLPGMVGSDLRTALKTAMDSTFHAPRQELLKGIDFDSAYNNFKTAKQTLDAGIDQLSDDESKMLAETLASGAIFTKDASNKVTAIQSQIAPELKKFQARLKAYQTDIAQAAVQNVVQEIQKTRDEINTSAQKYVDQQDDGGLASYANTVLPQKISALQEQLTSLKNKVQEAQGELEDKKTEVSIASYDSDAAQYFVQAAKQKVEETAVLVQRSQLGQDAALTDIERSKLVVAQQDVLTQAATKGIDVAAESLRRAYFQCLARGFDPMSGDYGTSDAAILANAFDGASLLGVMTGASHGKSARINLISQREGDAVAAMIQWIAVLGLAPSSGQRTNSFSYTLGQYAHLVEIERKGDWTAVQHIGQDLEHAFDNAAGDVLDVQHAAAEKVQNADVVWFNDMKPDEKSYWSRGVTDTDLKEHLLGAFVFTFSVDDAQEDKLVYVPSGEKLKFSYYMSPKDAVVSADSNVVSTSHLTFVLFAPENPLVNPQQAVGTFPSGPPIERQFSSLSEAEWLRDIRNSLVKWQRLSLSGAIGRWRILFGSSTNLSDSQKKAFREDLNLSLRIPYLRVSIPAN